MFLFTIIKLLSTLRLSRQKTNFFRAISRRFGLIGGIILGKNTVLYLENDAKYSNEMQEIGVEKTPQSVIVRLTFRAEKALRQRNK